MDEGKNKHKAKHKLDDRAAALKANMAKRKAQSREREKTVDGA